MSIFEDLLINSKWQYERKVNTLNHKKAGNHNGAAPCDPFLFSVYLCLPAYQIQEPLRSCALRR
jgi:hypothetical protein